MSNNVPSALKDLGQHYLKNPSVIETICDQPQFIADSEFILEIGPGPATLTHELASKGLPVIVVEKDKRFEGMLKSVDPSPQIVFQDALEFDLKNYLGDRYQTGWLVSNLPYNVSVPLLISFLNWEPINSMTLMFQKEVGEKILCVDRNNSLACLVGNYFEAKQLLKLKPGAFQPPPEVDSIVINFKRRSFPQIPQEEFLSYEKFLRNVFASKRKQLQGHLKKTYPREKLQQFFTNKNIDEKIRAEKLSFEEIIELYQWLRKE